MEQLSELPPKNDTVKTPEEMEIFKKFFPGGNNNPNPSYNLQNGGGEIMTVNENTQQDISHRMNWKFIGLTALLFFALANPWIDKILCKIPYCGDNSLILLFIKTLVFLLLVVVISLFV